MEGEDLVTSTLLLSDDSHRCEGVFQVLMVASALQLPDIGVVGFAGKVAHRRATKAEGSTDDEDGMARSNVARFRHATAFIFPSQNDWMGCVYLVGEK